MTATQVAERVFDEAFTDAGEPRPGYGSVLERLERVDPDAALAHVRRQLLREGCTFGEGDDCEAFKVDLIPRVICGDEWIRLARGLEQRVRALDAFVRDIYRGRTIVSEGVIPH